MLPDYYLQGKKIFITGGTGGIGSVLVKLLEREGAKVNVYDKDRDGDLVENLSHIKKKLENDTPDILINMAGYNDLNFAENQNYDSLVNLNMMVPMHLTQAVLPAMKKRNEGHIVNIGSMTALIPLPHLTGYVAAKAGLKGFNDSLRRELSGTKIIMTHIIPRAVNTSMNSGIKAEMNKRTNVRHDDPEYVASLIFDAIIKGKKEVRIGWPERFFAFINSICPAVIDKGLEKNRRLGEILLNSK